MGYSGRKKYIFRGNIYVCMYHILLTVHLISADIAGVRLRAVCVRKLAYGVIITTLAGVCQRKTCRLLVSPAAQCATKGVLLMSAFHSVACQVYPEGDEQRHHWRHYQSQLQVAGNKSGIITVSDARHQKRSGMKRASYNNIFTTRMGSILEFHVLLVVVLQNKFISSQAIYNRDTVLNKVSARRYRVRLGNDVYTAWQTRSK